MTVVDINIVDDPYEVAKYYFNDLLFTDIVAIFPYHIIWRSYCFIRLIRVRRFKLY